MNGRIEREFTEISSADDPDVACGRNVTPTVRSPRNKAGRQKLPKTSPSRVSRGMVSASEPLAEVSGLLHHPANGNLSDGDAIVADEFSGVSHQVFAQGQPVQDTGLADGIEAVSQPVGTEAAPKPHATRTTEPTGESEPEVSNGNGGHDANTPVRSQSAHSSQAGETPDKGEGAQDQGRNGELGNDTPSEARGIWVPEMQKRLAEKTVANPEHRFSGLYDLICDGNVLDEAATRLLGNKGSRTPGLDGITRDVLRRNREHHLRLVQRQLRAKTFRPDPVQRVYIPKANGKMRPLGIPTLYDRWVQMAVKIVIEPIFESNFAEYSHGFRPGRSCHTAMAHIHRLTVQVRRKVYWVIEGDIEGCFDHVHHKRLMSLLRERIRCKDTLDLIWKFLKAGVMEGQVFKKTNEGTPQGGILSPLLANIYLNRFDQWFAERTGLGTSAGRNTRLRHRQAGGANYMMVRYADDFVVFSNGTKADTEAFKAELAQWFTEDLRLTLSPEKTRITHYTDGFDFLGYTFKKTAARSGKREVVVTYPSTESVQKAIRRIGELTDRKTLLNDPKDQIEAMNAFLRGWGEYFRKSSAKATLRYVGSHAHMQMWKWLQQKSGARHGWKAVKQHYGRDNTWVADGVAMVKVGYMPVEYPRCRKIPNPYLAGQPVTEPRHYDPFQAEWAGWNDYGTDWRAARDAVRTRDGGCVVCGAPDVEIHHIRDRKRGGSNHPSNLVALCRLHHRDAEQPGTTTYRLIRETPPWSGEPDAPKGARPVREGML